MKCDFCSNGWRIKSVTIRTVFDGQMKVSTTNTIYPHEQDLLRYCPVCGAKVNGNGTSDFFGKPRGDCNAR